MRILPAVLLVLIAIAAVAAEPSTPPPVATGIPVPPWQSPLSQDHVLAGRIWLPAQDRMIEPAELIHQMASADFVLLGENHDNPDHHRLQAWILQRLVAMGRRPRVAFEMLAPEQEAALRRHRTEHPGQIDGLDSALDWPHSHWPEWSNYRPLFATALAAGLDIRAANLPIPLVRALARRQAVPEATLALYRLDQALDGATAVAMAKEIRDSHCGQLPEPSVPAMVDVQRARDAAMALALTSEAPAGAVLIAGAGHARIDRGVPVQIAALAPGRTVYSLAFIEVDDGADTPTRYGESWGTLRPPFDAIWFTPRAHDDDPCAGLADLMKAKEQQKK